MRFGYGRYLFGLVAVGFGLGGLIWHDFNLWQQIPQISHSPSRWIAVDVISVLEIAGGVAIGWRRTAGAGAAVVGIVYLFFALLRLALYVQTPLVYDNLGNFFEQFSMVCGALFIYAAYASHRSRSEMLAGIAYYGFALCVVSFTLEQALYLRGTADFIPSFIPAHMFFAVATTIAFGVAAIALLSGLQAPLAARLTTVMIALFGLLVWLPAPVSNPHDLNNWAGIAESFGICAAAWIAAEYLRQCEPLHDTREDRVDHFAVELGKTR